MAKLTIIPTPIGNLGDLSERVKEALTRVDRLLVEDTRVTQKLLAHLDSRVPMTSCFEQKEMTLADSLMNELAEKNEHWGLCSDAGTPAISDPGSVLVDAAFRHGIEVTALPGPSALSMALSMCGFTQDPAFFPGFPPRKSGDLVKWLESLPRPSRTCFYESPHRIQSTVKLFSENLEKNIQIVLFKELSKKFEALFRGNLSDVLSQLKNLNQPFKGEWCAVLHLPQTSEVKASNEHIEPLIQILLERGLSQKDLSLVFKNPIPSLSRSLVYDLISKVKNAKS